MALTLYYSPGSCALTAHILMNEMGVPYKLVKVSLADKTTSEGEDYWKINPKGYVPALKLEEGRILTEGLAIAQYLAELKPEAKLLPAVGTYERYEVISWFHFISTELHKNYSPLFYKTTSPEHRAYAQELLGKRLSYANQALADCSYLVGGTLTLADVYLYNVLSWSRLVGIDLNTWPNLARFVQNLSALPSVKKATQEQGLSAA